MSDNNKERKRLRDIEWQQGHRERMSELARLRRQDLQDKFFEMYGSKCACPGCSETNRAFLTLDHINNDGYLVRCKYGESKKYGNFNTYKEAVKEYRPDKYQTLCFNCNCGKNKNGGTCPHLGINKVPLIRTNRRSKLTQEQVNEIRSTHVQGSHVYGISALAKRYGVWRCTVEDIILNKTWKEYNSYA